MPIIDPLKEKDINERNELENNKNHSLPSSERQIFFEKESFQEKKNGIYEKILSKTKEYPQQEHFEHDIKKDAIDIVHKNDAESQVQHLVHLALEKGVVYAVKVAKHMEDNYVLDMFHNRLLSDELYEALLKKGLIKKI